MPHLARARLAVMSGLIDRYLIKEIIPYVFLSLLILTAIIFAHDASRFAELLVVSSRNGLPMQALWRVMAALVPGILVFTLPISFLVGTLVGLTRLSGDSEIVALGASGISRTRVLSPIVAIAVVIAAAMVYLTFNVLPHSIRNLNDLKSQPSLVFQGLNTEIKARVFVESIPKKVLYIEDIDRATNTWHNIFLVDLADERGNMKIMTATSGALLQGSRANMPELFLRNGSWHQFNAPRNYQAQDSADLAESESPEQASGADQPEVAQPAESPNSPERDREKEEKKRNKNQSSSTVSRFEKMTLGVEVPDGKGDGAAAAERERQPKEMEWSELMSGTPAENDDREWLAEMHKRVALPAACLVFALLGVGFGISNIRTGRSFGLLLGLAITIVYYLLALSGEHAAVSGKLPVWLGMWIANLVLAAIGLFVLIIQRRPGSDVLSVLTSVRHAWPSRRNKEQLEKRSEGAAPGTIENGKNRDAPERRTAASRSLIEPQLIDRLVLSDLARSFFSILGGFSVLFIIITLFQLLDYITRNNTEWAVVANYLIFLLPMIANYMTPPAALVAVMITFGVLQKTSQVVALKASGQSIYRLAVPVLLASLLLSCIVFVNQDYILPFTNRRQNNLRYLIRRGQEPPQTFYQTTNQWIFGSNSRIYNYAHFEPTVNVFANLNVLDLSREPFGIKARLYARRATWDNAAKEWVLQNGWERRFNGEEMLGFESFVQKRVSFPEGPEYFKKDFRGSSSMTLAELRRKIADLSRSGFDVADLRVALQGKIAFPLTCFIMVIVGLPFSLSVGKRGALYGVTIGIAIGLGYWGLLGLFEQMGRYEMLPPVLAAWGPNILFGAGGVYLFLTSRT
jgi:LPS export ABC transporter permease LptG